MCISKISVNDLTFYYEGSYDNIFENVSFQIDTDWKLGFIARNGKGKTTFLNLLQVEGDVLYRPFETLSNGEQTKVLLALLFSRENHFLLIDEPTNHLDMESREILKNYLDTKKGYQTAYRICQNDEAVG